MVLRNRNVRNRELWILIVPIRLWLLQAGIENIKQQTICFIACHILENSFLSYSSCSSLCHLIFFFNEIISFSTYRLYLLSLVCSQIFYVIILAIFHIDALQRCILLSFPCLHFNSSPHYFSTFSRSLAPTFHLLDIFLFFYIGIICCPFVSKFIFSIVFALPYLWSIIHVNVK